MIEIDLKSKQFEYKRRGSFSMSMTQRKLDLVAGRFCKIVIVYLYSNCLLVFGIENVVTPEDVGTAITFN